MIKLSSCPKPAAFLLVLFFHYLVYDAARKGLHTEGANCTSAARDNDLLSGFLFTLFSLGNECQSGQE